MGNKSIDNIKEISVSKPFGKNLNRRHFLLGIAAISTSALIPSVISCVATPKHDIHGQLTDKEFATLISIQNHLFPKDDNSPGAEEIHAAQYYTWVLSDTEKDIEDRERLRDGVTWVNDMALTNFGKPFNSLDDHKKEQTLRYLEGESWGKNWISITLTLIFEALLSDPVYGSNTNQKGWKWLGHQSGNPRPTADNKYQVTL